MNPISNIPAQRALETVFKRNLGFPNAFPGSSFNQEIGQTSARSKIVASKQLFTQIIPDIPPTILTQDVSFASKFIGNTFNPIPTRSTSNDFPYLVRYSNIPLTAISAGISYRCNTSYRLSGVYVNLLENAIPSDYGNSTGVSNGQQVGTYRITVQINDGTGYKNIDFFSPEYPWIFDSDSGVLTFFPLRTPTVPTSGGLPIISFWRYEGEIGLGELASGTFDVAGTNTTLKPKYTLVQAPKFQAGTTDFVDPSGSSTVLDVYGNANFGQPYMKPALYYKLEDGWTAVSVAISHYNGHVAVMAKSISNSSLKIYIFNRSNTPPKIYNFSSIFLTNQFKNNYLSNIVIDNSGNAYFAVPFAQGTLTSTAKADNEIYFTINFFRIPNNYNTNSLTPDLIQLFITTGYGNLRLAINRNNTHVIAAFKSKFDGGPTYRVEIIRHIITTSPLSSNTSWLTDNNRVRLSSNGLTTYEKSRIIVSAIINDWNGFSITSENTLNENNIETIVFYYNVSTNTWGTTWQRNNNYVYDNRFFGITSTSALQIRDGGGLVFTSSIGNSGKDPLVPNWEALNISNVAGAEVFAATLAENNYVLALKNNGPVLYSNNNGSSYFQIGPYANWMDVKTDSGNSTIVAITATEVYSFSTWNRQTIAFQSPRTQVIIGDIRKGDNSLNAALTVDGGLLVKNDNSIVAGFGNRIQVRGLDANIDVSGTQGSIKLITNESVGNNDGSALILTNNKNNNWGSQISFNKRITGGTLTNNLLGLIEFQGTLTNNNSGRAGYIVTYQDGAASTIAVPGRLQFHINDGISEKERLRINRYGTLSTFGQGLDIRNTANIPLLTMDAGGRITGDTTVNRTYQTNSPLVTYKKIVVSPNGRYQAAITDTELYLSDDFGENWLTSAAKYGRTTSDFVGQTLIDVAVSDNGRLAIICSTKINFTRNSTLFNFRLVNTSNNTVIWNIDTTLAWDGHIFPGMNIEDPIIKTSSDFGGTINIINIPFKIKTYNEINYNPSAQNITLYRNNNSDNITNPYGLNNIPAFDITRENYINSFIIKFGEDNVNTDINFNYTTNGITYRFERSRYNANDRNFKAIRLLIKTLISFKIFKTSMFFIGDSLYYTIGYKYTFVDDPFRDNTGTFDATKLNFNFGLYVAYYKQTSVNSLPAILNETTLNNIKSFNNTEDTRLMSNYMKLDVNTIYFLENNYNFIINRGILLWRDFTLTSPIFRIQIYDSTNFITSQLNAILLNTNSFTNILGSSIINILVSPYTTNLNFPDFYFTISNTNILYLVNYAPVNNNTSVSNYNRFITIATNLNARKILIYENDIHYLDTNNNITKLNLINGARRLIDRPNSAITDFISTSFGSLIMFISNNQIHKYIIPHLSLPYTEQCLGVGTNNPEKNIDLRGTMQIKSRFSGIPPSLEIFNNGSLSMPGNGSVAIGTDRPISSFHMAVFDNYGNSTITIGANQNEGNGTADRTTYDLERSRNIIQFTAYHDAKPDRIGAKIVAINKQTFNDANNRHLIQSTDLAFFTVPPNSGAQDATVERMRITDDGRTVFNSLIIQSVGFI